MSEDSVAKSYNVHAEQWAERLKSGNNPAHRFLEKPAMFDKLPDLTGMRVLCIGCGSGEEVEMLLARGASAIHGIDISESLIDIAKKTYPQATFEVRSMEELNAFADDSFDFVYSSLTMHYSDYWEDILREVYRLLRWRGRMLFSTHHPVKWGSRVDRGETQDAFTMGYERPKQGMPTVYGDYLGTRRITDQWFGTMTVEYYHRPLSAIIRDIIGSGLTIVDFIEPLPTAETVTANPSFWEIHSKIPLFMIFELSKERNV
jgi:ubiquinone/menaquinone biosynthesis C-methylase UbiE